MKFKIKEKIYFIKKILYRKVEYILYYDAFNFIFIDKKNKSF